MNESFAARDRAGIDTPSAVGGGAHRLPPNAGSGAASVREAPTSFAQDLACVLADGLEFLETTPDVFGSHVALSEAYGKAYSELQERRASLERWLAEVLRVNLLVAPAAAEDPPLWRDELQQLEESLVKACRLPPMPLSRRLTAGLAARPLLEAYRVLQQEMRSLVEETAAAVETLLERLAADQRLGRVEWVTDDACKFTWWSAELADAGREARVAQSRDVKGELETVTVTRVRKGHKTVRHGRHEQHLLGAEATMLDELRMVTPDVVAGVLSQTPRWLRPAVRVVAGQRVRQLDIVRESTDRWDASQVVSRRTQTVVHHDPAVVLGPYCLTGWSDEDESAERQRRRVVPWLLAATLAVVTTPAAVGGLAMATGSVGVAAGLWWGLGAALGLLGVRAALGGCRAWKPETVPPSLVLAGCVSLVSEAGFVTLTRPSLVSAALLTAGLIGLPPAWRLWKKRLFASLPGVRWRHAGRGQSYGFAVLWELL